MLCFIQYNNKTKAVFPWSTICLSCGLLTLINDLFLSWLLLWEKCLLLTMAGKCSVGRQCSGSADHPFLSGRKQTGGKELSSWCCPPGRMLSQLRGQPPGPAACSIAGYPVLLFCCWAVQDDRLGCGLWLSRVLSLPRLVRKTQFGVIQIPNPLALLLPEIWEKERVFVGVVSFSVF